MKPILYCMGLIAMTQQSHATGVSVVSESNGSHSSATIVQTTPGEKSPSFDIESGPGYVIVKQRGANSRAVIIQGTGVPQEK